MKDRQEPKLTKRKEAIWRQQTLCKDKKTINTTKQKLSLIYIKIFKRYCSKMQAKKCYFKSTFMGVGLEGWVKRLRNRKLIKARSGKKNSLEIKKLQIK